jgi:hypothetical protein
VEIFLLEILYKKKKGKDKEVEKKDFSSFFTPPSLFLLITS